MLSTYHSHITMKSIHRTVTTGGENTFITFTYPVILFTKVRLLIHMDDSVFII